MYDDLEPWPRKTFLRLLSLFRALILQPLRILANNPCVGVCKLFASRAVVCFDLETTSPASEHGKQVSRGEKALIQSITQKNLLKARMELDSSA
jgi:hypothetical protein